LLLVARIKPCPAFSFFSPRNTGTRARLEKNKKR
jgi:hypothetical protein